jgi:Raf kinase inhibitor-like YbhB/YbcL family protein
MTPTLFMLLALIPWPAAVAAADTTSGGDPAMPVPITSLSITSPAFAHQAEIPREYTCDGSDRSPPLVWSEVPPGTRSLALIVHDPDVPDPKAPKRIWVHWVLYDIPPSATGLPEAVGPTALPPGTKEGQNDWGRTGYGGPCPPIGRHRYFHRLYALDTVLSLGQATKTRLEQAMAGHILGEAELIGTYQRQR